MRRRNQFRPAVCEALEERMVMSHGHSFWDPLGITSALFGGGKHKDPAVTVGAMGDSYTDEYRFYPPDQSLARNWVEILASLRPGSVSFGPFSTASRGEPRDQGFALNWARRDATSGDMIASQLPGLAAQVAKGRVQYAWVFIGGDDFLLYLDGVRNGSIPPASALAGLAQVEARAEANFRTAVDTLLAASPRVKLVVATLPDVGVLPIARQGAAGNPQLQALLGATSQAILKYNTLIETVAASSRRIALVDLAGAMTRLQQAQQLGSVPFGGATIDLVHPGDDYHHFFLADGIHVGTVAQGIIANDFITAIDAHFHAQVRPLSPQQIVAFARMAQARSQHGDGPP